MRWNTLRKLTQLTDLDSSFQNASETLGKLAVEFDSVENVTKALYRVAKKLLEHITNVSKFETKLTDDLTASNLFSNDKFMRGVAEDWHSFAFITNSIGDEYVMTLQNTLIKPLKQMKGGFADLRAAIRMNDSIQLEVIRLQRKVASYNDKDKTGANLVKLQDLQQALRASQMEFARRTHILISDLSKFLAENMDMLRPILESFIAAEVTWTRACKRAIDDKAHITTAAQLETQSERLKTIEDSFKSLSSLPICCDK